MGKNPGETPKDKSEQCPRTPERGREDTERGERQEPGAGGISKAKYDEATEKAVKDIHD
jgi:hypothetical protein